MSSTYVYDRTPKGIAWSIENPPAHLLRVFADWVDVSPTKEAHVRETST